MAVKKEHYEELNDRQAALVDSVAELRARDMEVTPEKVSEGMEKQGFVPYADGTIGTYIPRYKSIIEDRMQMLVNDRNEYEGDEKVSKGEDGRPVIDATWQDITERPNKGEPLWKQTADESTDEEVEEAITELDENSFLLQVNEDLVFSIIRTAEESVAREIFDRVLNGGEDNGE